MILWMILTVMCCAACVAVAVPLIRGYESQAAELQSLAFYRAQLAEVDREAAAGQIGAADAEIAKAEIQRRMLTAVKTETAARPVPAAWRTAALVLCVAFVALGGVTLYNQIGRPDLAIDPPQPQAASQPAQTQANDGTVDDKIAILETRLKDNPKDAKGWSMLGWAQFNMERFDKSVEAYGKAVALEPANLDYKSAYAEAQVQSAKGVVTPAARSLIDEVLRANPKEERSRFYDALAKEQAGDLAGALQAWVSLYKDGAPDAGWLEEVHTHANALAKKTGQDVSADLAPKAAAASPGSAVPAPDPQDAAAIKAMPAQDQQAMIASMVDRLEARLKESPKDAEGWMRLIKARMVLKETDKAKTALTNGLAAFAGDNVTQDAIKAAASGAGLAVE